MSYLIPDRPIAFNRDFVRLGIGITGALFLSQLVYWSKRTKDCWFYKTADEWEEETGMSRKEQETARKRLREAGILSEKKQGIPAKLYFMLNENKLIELMDAVFYDDVKQVSTDGGNSMTPKGECNTETTQETTTDNKKTSKKESIELYQLALNEVDEKTELPGDEFFICLDAFEKFQEHRKVIKKPVKTTGPFKLLWMQLIEIRSAGISIDYALEQMVLNEWQTVKLEYLKGVQSQTTNKDPFGFDNV